MEFDARYSVPFRHRIIEADDVFGEASKAIAHAIGPTDPEASPPRILPFLDAGLDAADPMLAERIARKLATRPAGVVPAGAVHITPGGEPIKNDPAAWQRAVVAIDQAKVCRQSYVLIVGGGAVLDAIGFAAATTHRGVRVIRVPSTTLSQGDSAIGVKCGINGLGKKNLIGTFAPPHAVVLDHTLLSTLSDQNYRAGFSEAVKVALLKDPDFFADLERNAGKLRARDQETARRFIWISARLHAEHITGAGDPFELTTARPLDLGHWSAHKIEQRSSFQTSHGDAVATGLAIDAHYARLTKLCDASVTTRTVEALQNMGFPLSNPVLSEPEEIIEGIEEFREHLGGRLTITLVRAPGDPVDVHEIDRSAMLDAIATVQQLGPSAPRSQGDPSNNHRAIRHRSTQRRESSQ